jgi:hypothetical protein
MGVVGAPVNETARPGSLVDWRRPRQRGLQRQKHAKRSHVVRVCKN